MSKNRSKLLNRVDLSIARELFVVSCAMARAHNKIAAHAFYMHGDHGAQISGCVREHFPEPVKDVLRKLANAIDKTVQYAYESRPPGVRVATIRALSRAVASRDGSGFYGPQP